MNMYYPLNSKTREKPQDYVTLDYGNGIAADCLVSVDCSISVCLSLLSSDLFT